MLKRGIPQLTPGDRLCSFHIFKNFAEKSKYLKSHPMAEKQYVQWTSPTGLRLGPQKQSLRQGFWSQKTPVGGEKWSGEGKKINKGLLLWATETLRGWLCPLKPLGSWRVYPPTPLVHHFIKGTASEGFSSLALLDSLMSGLSTLPQPEKALSGRVSHVLARGSHQHHSHSEC